ncbi:MAG TPA: hypothetical protein VFQ44_09345 [Streptosporangiaceae bacterium]|nr:hypothetical protein [Streptosporangiaceae bacterium]
MAGTLRVSRSRGAFSGVLLIVLGLWGGLVPLLGPYLNYAYTPDKAWTITSGRLWLELLPGAVAIVGGAMVLVSKLRPWAMLGASLAIASGAWFAFGTAITNLAMKNPPTPGTPIGGSVSRAVEHFGFFTGLGAVLIGVAAIALGRLSIISARDARWNERAERSLQAERDLQSADTGTVPTALTTSAPRKTPMAALTRLTSRDKSDRSDDSGSGTSAPDRVSSGSARS